MDKGIYTALSGGIAKTHELELIANNLANSNTAGDRQASRLMALPRIPDSLKAPTRTCMMTSLPGSMMSEKMTHTMIRGLFCGGTRFPGFLPLHRKLPGT